MYPSDTSGERIGFRAKFGCANEFRCYSIYFPCYSAVIPLLAPLLFRLPASAILAENP
jgi:hypothetical protein